MIDVSRGAGRFKQIGVRVKNTLFEVSDLFPYHRHPGERRTIKRIDFNDKSINRREGKRTVEVFEALGDETS
jgi:hypothetical protein